MTVSKNSQNVFDPLDPSIVGGIYPLPSGHTLIRKGRSVLLKVPGDNYTFKLRSDKTKTSEILIYYWEDLDALEMATGEMLYDGYPPIVPFLELKHVLQAAKYLGIDVFIYVI